MRYTRTLATLLLCSLLLTGCGGQNETESAETAEPPQTTPETEAVETEMPETDEEMPETEPVPPETPEIPTGEALSKIIRALPDSDVLRQADIADVTDGALLDSLPDTQKLALADALTDCTGLTEARNLFREITGYTFHAWRDIRGGSAGTAFTDGTAELVFTGDVCLADDWYNMQLYHRMGSDITNNITKDLRGWLADADITLMNCECTLSDRGTPTEHKLYTFRGKPENAEIFSSLGVDIVSLANNHAHDYGRDAFLDTMDALDAAGVAYVGGGENLTEAMAYRSFIADGMKIAYVAASNAEKWRMTPGATDTAPGIFLMYEEENILAALDKAAGEADVVVAYVHWGTENSTAVNADQQKKKDLFIDHGADVIIGAHPHVLQPWEICDGVPVVYSLGNFWFNAETVETAIASVDVSLTDTGVSADCALYACIQSGGVTGFREEMGG
ncbi:MAG: CapA family protein [Ruminococcaceae bacterium]|nr:CapA family protein [Oscillospiraceae bacterium]